MNLLHCSNAKSASRADVRREHLLDCARKLFVDQGFHGTGVAQIASCSGVKVGQIYRDFQCKEDIIAAIVGADLAHWLDHGGLCAAVESRDVAAVRAWIAGFLRIDDTLADHQLLPEIIAESARNERIAMILRALDAKVRASMIAALETFAPGDARASDRHRVADLFMTLGIGLSQRRIMDPAIDLSAVAAQLRQIVDREIDVLLEQSATAGNPPR